MGMRLPTRGTRANSPQSNREFPVLESLVSMLRCGNISTVKPDAITKRPRAALLCMPQAHLTQFRQSVPIVAYDYAGSS